MEKQLSFFSEEHPEQEELYFIDNIFPKLKAVLSSCGANPENLSFDTIQGKTVVRYKPVQSDGRIIFRIRIRKKSRYMELHKIMTDLIPKDMLTTESDGKYIRIIIEDQRSPEDYISLLASVTKETLNRWPKDWDCCSRFEKCSDEKKCVHPNKDFALGCGYRKILNSGRIFYGKNRNID